VLQTLLPVCAQRIAQHASPVEMVRALTGQDIPPGLAAQLQDAPPPVFVLSGHMQQAARAVRSEHTLWLFFGLPPHPALWRRSPVGQGELLARLQALADQTSLHILALLTQQEEMSAQAIIARLQLSQPSASRHLKQLSTAGFIQERRQGGAAKVYRLTPAYIAQTFQALEQFLTEPAPAMDERTEPSAPGVSDDLRRLLDDQGRVLRWPARRRDQLAVLDHLAAQFEARRQYTEKEVNTLLLQWHLWNDPAFLRRELVDAHRLDRTRNGARYWRVSD
jgi:predicted transcriptional regulator